MLNRKREADTSPAKPFPTAKRTKYLGRNNFEELSDELVLRILSCLSVSDILNVELVCNRFRCLASDNGIWRGQYYHQFVYPRARRLPGIKRLDAEARERAALQYASKSAKWLEISDRFSKEMDWKRRYKVKQNWQRGRCNAHEVTLDCPAKPRILVKVHRGVIITASQSGLRSYSQRARPQLQGTHFWEIRGQQPVSLAVDGALEHSRVVVGFENGTFELYLAEQDQTFKLVCRSQSIHAVPISSVTLSWPYLLTMSDYKAIGLYEYQSSKNSTSSLLTAVNLTQLHCNASLLPVSLDIRKRSTELVASVVYSFSRFSSGWCLGLQEIRLSLTGDPLSSRLASTVETPLKDFPLRNVAPLSSRSTTTPPLPLHPHLTHPPNSLSHSGCYILAGLPDNTLMVYTITSTPQKLEISAGRRLWGHTSAVSGAEVSDRGKALSISARGDEVRVWELEDILSSYSLRKTSTQLRPRVASELIDNALARRGNGLGLAIHDVKRELAWRKHWVGFDEEQVVVLGERDQRQILSCYDFA